MKEKQPTIDYLPNLAWLFETIDTTGDTSSIGATFTEIMDHAVDSDHQEQLADAIGSAIVGGDVIVKTASGKLCLTSKGKEAALDHLVTIHS